MSSTGRCVSHSELTSHKPKGRISTKKNRTLDLKIQKQISPIPTQH